MQPTLHCIPSLGDGTCTSEGILDSAGVTLLKVFCKYRGSNLGPLYLDSSARPLSHTFHETFQPVVGVAMYGLTSLN